MSNDAAAQVEALSRRNAELQRLLETAREQIGQLRSSLDEANAPPHSFATVRAVDGATADVVAHGRKMRVAMLPALEGSVRPGDEVLLNAMSVLVGTAEPHPTGQAAIVREVLDDLRVLVVARGEDERVVELMGGDAKRRLHEGDTVIMDPVSGFAFDKVDRTGVEALVLEEIPEVDYQQIGGLAAQIERIRDALELPLRHPDLYRKHQLQPPRGLLLYGPPGCGKTLIAKAVAHSLADAVGSDQSYFLSVKGPELLNKYVGETERYIRTIFDRARSKASTGAPVVVFFDEMDALFRSRGSGVSSDIETTIVPQLLTELDGVEGLSNVIVIGASNREDMIDPAILRPGRLDVKIEIARPDAASAADILSKYVVSSLPLAGVAAGAPENVRDKARWDLIAATVDELFSHDDAHMHVSGAMLRNIVDRAKTSAIKSEVAGGVEGLSAEDLQAATRQELSEARAVAAHSLTGG